MEETLIDTQLVRPNGDIFEQILTVVPHQEPGEIQVRPLDEIQVKRQVSGENVALSIGMLNAVMPEGPLKQAVENDFQAAVLANDIRRVRPELLSLAIALTAFRESIEDFPINSRPHIG